MKKLSSVIVVMVLFSLMGSSQDYFRSGIFLHHSTGAYIWGPNPDGLSTTTIPEEMHAFNLAHGFTGNDSISMQEEWWSPGDNEWATQHEFFEGNTAFTDISYYLSNYRILVIKSCFPSSAIESRGQPSDTIYPYYKTIYNYKWHWRHILTVMKNNPDNFFAIWTNAPLEFYSTNPTEAMLSKEFCTWAKDTLAEGLDPIFGPFPPNVYVFDYFNKLTNANGYQMSQYTTSPYDSHPNGAATDFIAPQFVDEIFSAALAYELVHGGPPPTPKSLNLKFFLEGLYAGSGMMNPVSDGVNPVFGSDIADTFHIELRPYPYYEQAFRSSNSILHTDGTAQILVPSSFSHAYHIVIRHRNSIETWSKYPVSFAGSVIDFDMSTSNSKAFADNQKFLEPGAFGIFSGDENQDGVVDANDMGDLDNDASLFATGYLLTDLNGDGIVDSNDLGIADNNSMAFVVVSMPTTYGMSCPGLPSITDNRDGRFYNTVLIGTQCWLRENLNIGTRINMSQDQSDNQVIEKYCFNDLESSCDVSGGLYQWNEMMQYGGASTICPAGWHVPTDNEWQVLEGAVDAIYQGANAIWGTTGWRGFDAGKNLKSTTGWGSSGTGTNLYGYTALPGGIRNFNGTPGAAGWGYYWTGSSSSTANAWYRAMEAASDQILRLNAPFHYGFSVRCLKDN